MTTKHKGAQIGNQNAKKDDEEKASSTLIFRVKPSDKATLVKAAKGRKLTEWVIETLLEAAEQADLDKS